MKLKDTCSLEEKLNRSRQCIKKQRRHFTKYPSRQSYFFFSSFSSSHAQLWELGHKEGRVPKNWCFQMVVLEETLEVPYIRRSIQSILKEINFEYSLEGLMLKLKLQYFGHLMWRADSLEKTLMLQEIESRRWRGWQRVTWLMTSLTHWTWVWANSGR